MITGRLYYKTGRGGGDPAEWSWGWLWRTEKLPSPWPPTKDWTTGKNQIQLYTKHLALPPKESAGPVIKVNTISQDCLSISSSNHTSAGKLSLPDSSKRNLLAVTILVIWPSDLILFLQTKIQIFLNLWQKYRSSSTSNKPIVNRKYLNSKMLKGIAALWPAHYH